MFFCTKEPPTVSLMSHYKYTHFPLVQFAPNFLLVFFLDLESPWTMFHMTIWKNRSERRKHCALAVVRQSQKFAPPQTPFPGARDGQNLISWRWSLPSPTDPVWWGSMHAVSSYRGNRPSNAPTNTNTHTHRQDRLQYTAPQLASAQW